jgi:formylglycine-generating enzyme required for sulfatase activity
MAKVQLYRPYPYNGADGREDAARKNDMRVIRGGGQAEESCDVRVSFRGYGSPESRYGVRYVMEQ